MRRLLIIISLTLVTFLAKSQKIEYFNDLMSDMYNFAIYEPAGYDPVNSTDMPVVMFLHGRSMSIGLDGYRYGTITSIDMGYDILKGQQALVLEPNARGNEGWGSVKLHKVYEFLKAHYAFDHDKFYVIGMSMGGWGTLNYVNKYPDEVAACVGICGGCDAKTPCGLNKVPTWIIHAADDETTDVACSDRVVEAMKTCGNTNLLKYSRLTSGGHSLINYFQYHNLYTWLFKHNRTNRRFDTSVNFVDNPVHAAYHWSSGIGESIYITQAELAKIQARTPKPQGSNTMASNSGTTTSNSTSNSGNSSGTTKPTSSNTSSSSSNTNSSSKPTTTNKPTSTSKPANTVTIKPRNTTSTAKPGTATVRPDYIGNPRLKNESAIEVNGSYQLSTLNSQLSVGLDANAFFFSNYIIGQFENRLSAMTVGAVGVKVYGNIDHATIANVSLTAEWRLVKGLRWSAKGTYSLGQDDEGEPLPLIAPFTYQSRLSYATGPLSLQAEVKGHARQSKYGQKYGETETAAWTIVNLSANYQFSINHYKLALRTGVENLFDKYYATYADWCHIPQKGRNIYVNLSFEI